MQREKIIVYEEDMGMHIKMCPHIVVYRMLFVPRLVYVNREMKRGRKMAFTVPEIVKTVEFRGLNTGVGGNGKTWMSLKVEYTTSSGSTIDWEINVPQDLQGNIYSVGLQKGDICDIVFTARNGRSQAGREYGYLQLERVPQLLDVDEDGVIS